MSESAGAPRIPLSPRQFFRRAADVYGNRTAVVDGAARLSYREFAARCARLAEGLRAAGLRPGDRAGGLTTT